MKRGISRPSRPSRVLFFAKYDDKGLLLQKVVQRRENPMTAREVTSLQIDIQLFTKILFSPSYLHGFIFSPQSIFDLSRTSDI